MSIEEIEAGRARDWRVKRQYFEASAWGSGGEAHADSHDHRSRIKRSLRGMRHGAAEAVKGVMRRR